MGRGRGEERWRLRIVDDLPRHIVNKSVAVKAESEVKVKVKVTVEVEVMVKVRRKSNIGNPIKTQLQRFARILLQLILHSQQQGKGEYIVIKRTKTSIITSASRFSK